MARARTLIEQADKSGAQRYAAADLQRAHDELNNADKSNAQRKYDEARRYAESAAADADVAAARAAAGQAQQAAREVGRGNESLRQESLPPPSRNAPAGPNRDNPDPLPDQNTPNPN